MTPLYPSLYQINTRVWLTDLSRKLGRTATLDDILETELDHFAEMGFDWVLVPERLANRCGRPASLPQQSRMEQRFRRHASRFAR